MGELCLEHSAPNPSDMLADRRRSGFTKEVTAHGADDFTMSDLPGPMSRQRGMRRRGATRSIPRPASEDTPKASARRSPLDTVSTTRGTRPRFLSAEKRGAIAGIGEAAGTVRTPGRPPAPMYLPRTDRPMVLAPTPTYHPNHRRGAAHGNRPTHTHHPFFEHHPHHPPVDVSARSPVRQPPYT